MTKLFKLLPTRPSPKARMKLSELPKTCRKVSKLLLGRAPRTRLSNLPNELLSLISSFLSHPPDILHLLLTCRHFAALFHARLYADNVRHFSASSLLWACRSGNIATASYAIAAGASPNYRFFSDQRLLDGKVRKRIHVPLHEARDLLRKPSAATPLGLAAQHRHVELVYFLLENGADPNLADEAPSRFHSRVWAPMHWALSCGRFTDRSNRNAYPGTAQPVPVSVEIAGALLKAGANPNCATLVDPVRGERRDTEEVKPGLPIIMAACCQHAPAETVRLLLDAGADQSTDVVGMGCRGYTGGGSRDLIKWALGAQNGRRYPHLPESYYTTRDEEIVYLLEQVPTYFRKYKLRLDEESVAWMLAHVSPNRIRIADMTWATPSAITVSGVFALLDVWEREKKATQKIAGEENSTAGDTMRQLEELIARLLGFKEFKYAHSDLAEKADSVDLGAAFLSFSRTTTDDNCSAFESLLESQGLFRHKGRPRLSVSDVLEVKLKMITDNRI
ncbi:hypothetical protein GGR57DRAFT_484839 [Xylariaceae sp. FL1272]|nr:hypothetical protein GGR57DRAFT_484839 [Xylariaceae sp. FL1272]